jgi:hypothetical protein
MKALNVRVFYLAFALAFMLLLTCSCSTATPREAPPVQLAQQSREAIAQEMISVFFQDRALYTNAFRLRNQIQGNQYADAIQRYTGGLRCIDYSRTPQAYQLAYLKHIQAWEQVAFELKNRPLPDVLPVLIDLGLAHATAGLSLLHGAKALTHKTPAQEASDAALLDAKRRIQSTWNDLEQLALQFGVRIKS